MISHTIIYNVTTLFLLVALRSFHATAAAAADAVALQEESDMLQYNDYNNEDGSIVERHYLRYLQESMSGSASYLSEQCRNDTDLLFAYNSTLALAADSLDASLPTDPGCIQLSSVSSSIFNYHCTYGYPEDALQQYEATCVAQGGQLATVESVTVVCSVMDTNTSTLAGSITIDFESFADCVAATCDLSLVDEAFGSFGTYLVNKMEAAIPASTCFLKQEQNEQASAAITTSRAMGGATCMLLLLLWDVSIC